MGAGASAHEVLDAANVFANASKDRQVLSKCLRRYARMRKAGVPLGACVQKAIIDHVSPDDIHAFVAFCEERGSVVTAEDIFGAFGTSEAEGILCPAAYANSASDGSNLGKVEAVTRAKKMIEVGVPLDACISRLRLEGASEHVIDAVLASDVQKNSGK